jgi:magnesium and cobalt transporter
VEGVFYTQDLFKHSRKQSGQLRDLMKAPLFIPDSMHLDELIERFRKSNVQIAIVVDEHGGTAGLVTLEDIIEAVFGKIQDHNEDPAPEIRMSSDGTITLQGDARIVELVEVFGWKLEGDGVDTIGGYLMQRLDRVLTVGDELKEFGRTFRVTKMDRNRIVEIVVKPS